MTTMDFRSVSKILSFNPICVSFICASFMIWRRFIKSERNYFKVTFFNPLKKSRCKCTNPYNSECLDANCSVIKTAEIICCLQNATKSIDICVFTLSHERIATEIIAAHKRGVVVRIIVSNCILIHGKEIKQLRNSGIELKCQNNVNNIGYMHNKFCVVDSKWLIHSSMNWTRQATVSNWESILITDLSSLISEFSNAFEYIWLNISND
ncbi:mitochondrial cardiolipin hydrolase-like isoform X2 [Sipha flava]|uniref:Mitochondrial cardiolipin hydrolase n=1 Tax=Sipha flava TaxID=143950 RepID=A0A2S2R860_9HEMI|nr:mitochondrial cardiolipin hydrolase-like isoform X2 [Sipha flava]